VGGAARTVRHPWPPPTVIAAEAVRGAGGRPGRSRATPWSPSLS
jgi:hypothetical protein